MEVITGSATHVKHSAIVHGSQQQGVGTIQLLTFRLGKQAVELAMASLPQIAEGDEIVVAGDIKDGTLHGRAYLNRSTGSFGRWSNPHAGLYGCLVYALLGIVIFFLLAMFFSFVLSGGGYKLTPIGSFSGLILAAIYVAYMWSRQRNEEVKTREALRLVRLGGTP